MALQFKLFALHQDETHLARENLLMEIHTDFRHNLNCSFTCSLSICERNICKTCETVEIHVSVEVAHDSKGVCYCVESHLVEIQIATMQCKCNLEQGNKYLLIETMEKMQILF